MPKYILLIRLYPKALFFLVIVYPCLLLNATTFHYSSFVLFISQNPKSTLIFPYSLQSLAFSPTLNYPCFSQMTSLSHYVHFILLFMELPFVTLIHYSLPILSLLRLLSLLSPLSQFSFYPFYFYLYVIFENWTKKR